MSTTNGSAIYLDFNASTPIAPEVTDALRPYLSQHFGNPSSQHWAGRPAHEAVQQARADVAALGTSLGTRRSTRAAENLTLDSVWFK
jgi:cysteine sulfinate desulfinase/cysteine desulfurase-like protein